MDFPVFLCEGFSGWADGKSRSVATLALIVSFTQLTKCGQRLKKGENYDGSNSGFGSLKMILFL